MASNYGSSFANEAERSFKSEAEVGNSSAKFYIVFDVQLNIINVC